MVDDKLILRKIADLDTYYRQIGEFRTTTSSLYRKDWKTQRIVERTLQMMIETCMDIASHIISDSQFRLPKNYADTFNVLEENAIIDSSLAVTMKKMVKFRNVVVHDYDKVEAEIVVGILRKNIDDFIRFKNVIIDHLKTLVDNEP